jgi:hypothetical protein
VNKTGQLDFGNVFGRRDRRPLVAIRSCRGSIASGASCRLTSNSFLANHDGGHDSHKSDGEYSSHGRLSGTESVVGFSASALVLNLQFTNAHYCFI